MVIVVEVEFNFEAGGHIELPIRPPFFAVFIIDKRVYQVEQLVNLVVRFVHVFIPIAAIYQNAAPKVNLCFDSVSCFKSDERYVRLKVSL